MFWINFLLMSVAFSVIAFGLIAYFVLRPNIRDKRQG